MTVPNAIDSDGNGELSQKEVAEASVQLRELDKNRDGHLDPREIGAYETVLPLVRSHNVTNIIDADGDIHISADEIENASSALKIFDQDGDWRISAEELALGRPLKAPVFSTRNLTLAQWEHFRAYTNKLEGPIKPGQDPRVSDGYILVHDASDYNEIQKIEGTYLLNQHGEKVHEWPSRGTQPEGTVAYLLPNGNLLRTYSENHWVEDKHFPVAAHPSIEIVSWEGEKLWDYTMSAPEKYSFHHDVEYMPNGNILAIRYTAFTKEEAIAMGWNQEGSQKAIKRIRNRMGRDGPELVWMEAILELKPNFEDGSTEIVWQWNSWDHLVQDEHSDRENFGKVSDPSLIDVNYLNLDTDVPFNAGQLFHVNTVDYNPSLDMIMLSSATYGEI